MAERLWKLIDCVSILADPPAYLDDTDKCFYALDYVSGGGFKGSDGNDLISNFQKSVSLRGQSQWKYKERAVSKVGLMIANGVPEGTNIAAIPTSKADDDPEFDDRLARALAVAKSHKPSLTIHRPIVRKLTSASAKSGASRKPNDIFQELTWVGFDGDDPPSLLLFDDVITSGGHYKACARLIAQHCPNMKVAGLFCAKTMWPAPGADSTTVTLGKPA